MSSLFGSMDPKARDGQQMNGALVGREATERAMLARQPQLHVLPAHIVSASRPAPVAASAIGIPRDRYSSTRVNFAKGVPTAWIAR
jgi:hypothetical protein